MHKDLKAVLAELGDTPMAEPKIYDLISGDGARPSKVFQMAAPKLDMGKYEAKEVAEFVSKTVDKVTGFRDEDGEFKVTPDTQDCEQPNFQESEDLYFLTHDKASETDKEKKKEIEDAIQEKVWEISGLDKEKLSEWEQMLVVLQIQSAAIDNTKTALGVQVKN